MSDIFAGKSVRITVGKEVHTVPPEVYQAKAAELFAKYQIVPRIELVDSAANDSAPEPTDPTPVAALVTLPKADVTIVDSPAPAVVLEVADEPARGPLDVEGGQHDIIGEARSTTDLEAAREAGFAPAQTIYTRGTRVIALGTENARLAREEYDTKPLVSDYCDELVQRVEAEDRECVDVLVADVQMNDDGSIRIANDGGSESVAKNLAHQLEHLAVEPVAFGDLVSSLKMPGGFRTALAEVCPTMRATMINMWSEDWANDEQAERAEYEEDVAACKAAGLDPAKEVEPVTAASNLVLRTRMVTGGESRSIFAAVTDSYTPFDVDKIARAIQAACPEGARGEVVYDGYRARFEVLFHTDVKPEHFVAGEFFRAGVIVTTDDTGGGSCLGSSVIWQNLCLNLIVIDEATQPLFRIRHVGSVEKMAAQFKKGFSEGLAKLDHFVKAWGYASREKLSSYLPKEAKGIPIEEAIPGFFNGMIERELVPVRGPRVEVVKHLTEAWKADDSSATVHHKGMTRAALANAFTRYAHTENRNVWLQDDIQRAAGAFVQSKAPVPYLALPKAEDSN